MTAALNLHALAQIAAERMLNSLVEGMAIALFAWLLLRLLGRRNSGTRFAVWFCALLAIVIAPFLVVSSAGGGALVRSATAAVTIPRAWAIYLFGAWAVIAAVGLVRVALGMSHLGTIRKNATAIDPQTLDPVLLRTVQEFQSARRVEICLSNALRVPTVIGFLKPAVILPAWAVRELSTAELNAVLLHELAHLGRSDDWTNLAQKVLGALFFFHPAVWWVENRLSLEREMACDDIVLAQMANPRAYAECLVSLAQRNFLRRGVALAQAAVGRMRQTSQRVLQILDPRRPDAVKVWKPAPWVVAAFSAVCLVSSAHAPRLVAFGDAAPATSPQSSTWVTPLLFQQAAASAAPRLVSASFANRTPAARLNPQKPVRRVRATVVRPSSPPRTRPLPAAARLIRTNMPMSAATPAPLQAVFVFMQGQQLGDSGPVLWHVSIWRFTIVPRGNPQVAPEISSKSI